VGRFPNALLAATAVLEERGEDRLEFGHPLGSRGSLSRSALLQTARVGLAPGQDVLGGVHSLEGPVPLIGTYIGVLLPVLATVFVAPWEAIVIVAFALVYQQIENYAVTPRISQKTMDVNPAIALAAVFIGAAVRGPIGALIGIPLVAAGVPIADTSSRRYARTAELAERLDPTAAAAGASAQAPVDA